MHACMHACMHTYIHVRGLAIHEAQLVNPYMQRQYRTHWMNRKWGKTKEDQATKHSTGQPNITNQRKCGQRNTYTHTYIIRPLCCGQRGYSITGELKEQTTEPRRTHKKHRKMNREREAQVYTQRYMQT